eukprot:gene21823-19116_t
MATDALSVVWGLAAAVKEAYDGVQGNKEQCKMLNDHVQNVAKALKGLPSATRQKKEVESAMRKLVETLRSATDLIEGFKTQNWIAKMFKQSSTKAKFDELFNELDKVLQVCGFALERAPFYVGPFDAHRNLYVAVAPETDGAPALEHQPWYHGGISRPVCEALLLGPACGPGDFCVRDSTRVGGGYSLSVRDPAEMNAVHFKIERVGAQWKLSCDNKVFDTVVQLIRHYQSVGTFSGSIYLAQAAPRGGAAAPVVAGAADD